MASQRPHERQTLDANVTAESSGEPSEQSSSREPVKSASSVLRELRESLDSTDALVAAYNNSQDEQECAALRKWIHQYVDWFDSYHAQPLEVGVLEEIASLAKITSKCREDAELVRKTIFFLGNQVRNNDSEERKPTAALSKALEVVDDTVFEGDFSGLLTIADALLCKVDPEKIVFTEETFPENKTALFALHQVFLLMQRISPSCLNAQHENGVFQSFKSRLSDILRRQDYFPSFFYAKIVEQCFLGLAQDSTLTSSVASRTLSLLSSTASIYRAVRRTLLTDIDVASLKRAYESIRNAYPKPNGVKQCPGD